MRRDEFPIVDKYVEQTINLVLDDIKTEIRAYFTAKDKHKHLTFDVEQDIMDIINRHMKGGDAE